MIASLTMYDWPELGPEHDRLWGHIRAALADEGLNGPEALTRGGDVWRHWRDPGLILGQTCGMPYRTRLYPHVRLVGTLDYGLPDTAPGYYYSHLIARADDPRTLDALVGGTLAFNGQDSQSGWAAPQNHVAPRRFDTILETGAHRESARAVADGRADIAAIDAVTWRLIVTHLPGVAERLRTVAFTEPTPGLPLVTARQNDPVPIARAVRSALARLGAADRDALGLVGMATIPHDAYAAVPVPTPPTPNSTA
ncbi:MAG: PhnD/SsuA/transferrin family substrate-binding protein [Rhodobacteraceae bacterium]|nr:PhnD/SsuA/transferrin family substrate-binding protein [Paracoccaceae bacterium]